eukprot:jgi/Chrzof1/6316/Cz18g04010.t1
MTLLPTSLPLSGMSAWTTRPRQLSRGAERWCHSTLLFSESIKQLTGHQPQRPFLSVLVTAAAGDRQQAATATTRSHNAATASSSSNNRNSPRNALRGTSNMGLPNNSSATASTTARAVATNTVAVQTATTPKNVNLMGSDEVLDSSDDDLDNADCDVINNIVPTGAFLQNLTSYRCLVVDSAYRPINVIGWFKAVVMDEAGKIDVLDYYPNAFAYSAYRSHPLPAVIRARKYVDLHEVAGHVALTRRNVMLRDRYTCQYCGCKKDLTLDHVVPVSKGGKNTWENLVTACMVCNQKKGHHSLSKLGWRLKHAPHQPTPYEIGVIMGVSQHDIEHPPSEWSLYLQPYKDLLDKARAKMTESLRMI